MKKIVMYLKFIILIALFVTVAKSAQAQACASCTGGSNTFYNQVDCSISATWYISCDGGVTKTSVTGPVSISNGGWVSGSTTNVSLPSAYCNVTPPCYIYVQVCTSTPVYCQTYQAPCSLPNGWICPTSSICTPNGGADVTIDACGNVRFTKPAICPWNLYFS
jgi:hypothetical protein